MLLAIEFKIYLVVEVLSHLHNYDRKEKQYKINGIMA